MHIDGDRLRQAREAALLTQRELSAKSGVGTSTINRLERGLQEAMISTVRKLAEALNVGAAELVNPNQVTTGTGQAGSGERD